MQSQLVCSGCRSMLLYPRGATNVCCALCSTITSVPPPAPPPAPPGSEMAQLICGGCRTLLMYTRGASSVRCSCCHTVNLASASNQFAHVNCANCRTMLMYPYGAPSVKCAICHYITNVGGANPRVYVPSQRPDGPQSGTTPSTSTSMPQSTQTVVVENPMSVDESGKLVTNVVVGVTTEKRTRKRFFVIANGMASLHNLLMMVVEIWGDKLDHKGLRLVMIAILDMMTVALASGGDGAAVFMAELGKKGNSHARWNKICDKFGTFCDHGGGAIISSFAGLVLLVLITAMSIGRLAKPRPATLSPV